MKKRFNASAKSIDSGQPAQSAQADPSQNYFAIIFNFEHNHEQFNFALKLTVTGNGAILVS